MSNKRFLLWIILVWIILAHCSCAVKKSVIRSKTETTQDSTGVKEKTDNSVITTVESISIPYSLPETELQGDFTLISGMEQTIESDGQSITFKVDSTGKKANVKAKTKPKTVNVLGTKTTTEKRAVKESEKSNIKTSTATKTVDKDKKSFNATWAILLAVIGTIIAIVIRFIRK